MKQREEGACVQLLDILRPGSLKRFSLRLFLRKGKAERSLAP
jgi:hypothetical protein